jgi:hypothetical protein
MTAGQAIQALIELEPALSRVSEHARDLQFQLTVSSKFNTGNASLDVVTQADYEVQKGLLSLLVDTPLVDCTLYSEEDSPELYELQKRFTGKSGLSLTIDPVDGTRRFVEGAPIVGLHDGKRPRYHFLYYPSFSWWLRLTDKVEQSGPAPFVIRLTGADNSIVYSNRTLTQSPDWLSQFDLASFRQGEKLGPEGSKMLFMEGEAGGYLALNPNAYDGLVGLHFGQARGLEILQSPGFSLAEPELTATGWCYPGGYAVLRKPPSHFEKVIPHSGNVQNPGPVNH